MHRAGHAVFIQGQDGLIVQEDLLGLGGELRLLVGLQLVDGLLHQGVKLGITPDAVIDLAAGDHSLHNVGGKHISLPGNGEQIIAQVVEAANGSADHILGQLDILQAQVLLPLVDDGLQQQLLL